MTEAVDDLKALLALGEGSKVEFKSSLRWDYRQAKINKDLTKVVVRAVAGLLNAQGGTVVVGVDDDGQVLGIAEDLKVLPKKSADGFELTLRHALSNHLGPSVDPYIRVDFIDVRGNIVVLVACDAHPEPVYFRDQSGTELMVRAGNLTRSLDVQSAVQYVNHRWSNLSAVSLETIRAAISDAIGANASVGETETVGRSQTLPTWLSLSTRRVLNLYLEALSTAHAWKKIFIISPWISDVDSVDSPLTLQQLVHRLTVDGATAYIVTRPPIESWHEDAIERIKQTGRASIAFLPELHTKLYTAQTASASFAMIGSANFTQKSLANREIGALIKAVGSGRQIVANLDYEASSIYRHPDRHLHCKATL